MNGLNPVSLILIMNSFTIISLVTTQNETSKDSASKNNSKTSPIEIILWVCVLIEIFMFLISEKITDF